MSEVSLGPPVDAHAYAVAPLFMDYNFVHIHKTLRVTPAMAAGMTDRLWEVSDVIELLEAWETKEKRDAKPIFEILEWKIGGGQYIRATLPNQTPEQINGFKSKGKAARWIRNESAVWLRARRLGTEKKEAAS